MIIHDSLILTVAKFLRDNLPADVYVGRTVPNPRRDRMVILANRGGSELDVARVRSLVDVNIWAKSDLEADNLASVAIAHLKTCADGNPIMKVRVVTLPVDVADSTGQPQRFVRIQMWSRGQDE